MRQPFTGLPNDCEESFGGLPPDQIPALRTQRCGLLGHDYPRRADVLCGWTCRLCAAGGRPRKGILNRGRWPGRECTDTPRWARL